MSAGVLDDIVARLGVMPAADRAVLEREVLAATADRVFVPTPGPQTECYFSQADEVYYGGEAGGGKSAILIGLALEEHTDSLILRRVNDDAKDIAKMAREMTGGVGSYNGQDRILRLNQREIRFGGCQFEDDKERYKGRARDFIGFDEVGDFTETQYEFITTWNRSAKPGQRSRVVAAGNPPTRPEGLWVVRRWAAWLDKQHPRPAQQGELRWYIKTVDDVEMEVEGRGPHQVGDETLYARSRTFIRARLDDNPFLAETDYRSRLDALPSYLRSAYRDGVFKTILKDDENQLIPSAWVQLAMDRWRPDGGMAKPMTALAVDPAGGGADAAEMAPRHGGWVGPFSTRRGADTNDGNIMAGAVVQIRRNGCPVIADGGGGYAGKLIQRLQDNAIEAEVFNGAGQSTATTNDASKLAFLNKRAEAHWRLREALDPSQEGGSIVALPPDPELRADLCAVHWWLSRGGIQIEDKDDIRSRIGRSPGKGDVVAILFSEGDRMVKKAQSRTTPRPATANLGHVAVRRRRAG